MARISKTRKIALSARAFSATEQPVFEVLRDLSGSKLPEPAGTFGMELLLGTELLERVDRETPIDSLQVGNDVYHFRRAFAQRLLPVGGGFEYSLEGFKPDIRATALTKELAFRRWKGEFHQHFQNLLSLHSHAPEDTSDAEWNELQESVDVDRYLDESPVWVSLVGRIVKRTPTAFSVQWEAAEEVEWVDPFEAPGVFVTFAEGERFEAATLRIPATWDLIEIGSCHRLPAEDVLEDDELAEILRSTPGSRPTSGEASA